MRFLILVQDGNGVHWRQECADHAEAVEALDEIMQDQSNEAGFIVPITYFKQN